jgi:hypothetical protein
VCDPSIGEGDVQRTIPIDDRLPHRSCGSGRADGPPQVACSKPNRNSTGQRSRASRKQATGEEHDKRCSGYASTHGWCPCRGDVALGHPGGHRAAPVHGCPAMPENADADPHGLLLDVCSRFHRRWPIRCLWPAEGSSGWSCASPPTGPEEKLGVSRRRRRATRRSPRARGRPASRASSRCSRASAR